MSAFSIIDLFFIVISIVAYGYLESSFGAGSVVVIVLSVYLMNEVSFALAALFLGLNLVGHMLRQDMLVFFSFMSLCSMILFRRRAGGEEAKVKVAIIDELVEGPETSKTPPKANKNEAKSPKKVEVTSATKEIVIVKDDKGEVASITEELSTSVVVEESVTFTNLAEEVDNSTVATPAKKGKKATAKTPATKEKKKATQDSVEDAIKQAQEEARLRMEERLKQLEAKEATKKK
jgi:hypothetical protein